MFDVFIFTNVEMSFTGIEKAFCVLEYTRSQLNKSVLHVFVREFSKQSPTAMQVWTWHKRFNEEGCLCRRKGSGRPKTSQEMVECVRKKSCNAHRNRYEEQVWKPRFHQHQLGTS